MPLFPQLVLIIWFPIVLLLFATVKPRRAVIVANVAAMLVLPNGGFVLPGLPDYSKTSGTSAAVLLGIVLFDFQRLVNFRPRWFDLPVVVWCGSYLVSSMSNDLGIYDGLSSATFQVLLWGVPYLTGRLYLTDLAGVRELTTAMIVGGLIYLPLCLYESKFSPVLEGKIYGMASQPYALPRFGLGYRPIVFMNTGLALGMWMIAVALAAYWRWFCGETRRIMKLTPGLVAALLLLGAIMTKSLGAWQLLAGGVGVLHLAKRTKKTWPVLLLVLLPLIYMGLRIPKFWSGQNMVAFTRQYFGEERAQSLETRVLAEDQLVDRALERPVWGWGGQGRSRVKNEAGADSVLTDGYWVIALGVAGFAGLAGLTATFLLPTYLFLRRIPVRHWSDPKVAPASALAVLLSLYMLDCLSNAMPNLVYAMAAGGITGLSAVHISTHRRRADELFEEGEAFRAEGDALAAEESYRAALILYAADSDPDAEGRAVQATCLEALATHLLASGRPDEAEGSLRDALAIRAALLAGRPNDLASRLGMAAGLETLGRLLKAASQPAAAEEAWLAAVGLRERLAIDFPDDLDHRKRWADGLNNLAWFLATRLGRGADEIARAVGLASQAVEITPKQAACWNTLGTAQFYAGDWLSAVNSLRKSAELGDGGTGFDHFFLAMTFDRLGDHDTALDSFRRAVEWMDLNSPDHPDLQGIRAQAAAMLGLHPAYHDLTS
jgi:tetratricopeptide (TPR) repeat protein